MVEMGMFVVVLGVSRRLLAVRPPRVQFFEEVLEWVGQTATPPGQTAKASGQTAVAPGQTASSPEPSWFWILDGQTASCSGQTARAPVAAECSFLHRFASAWWCESSKHS